MTRAGAAAIALCLLAWVPDAAAQTLPACPPQSMLGVTLTTSERGLDGPLVATHDADVEAEFTGSTVNESLTPPAGVRVVAARQSQLALIVPGPPSVAITVRWQQSTDPSGDPEDPATACIASRVVTLPVQAARPSRAVKLRDFKRGWGLGIAAFAVVPALKQPDLSPLEISIRTSSRARLPKPGAKARTMPVPMRTVDQVNYPKKLPSLFHIKLPRLCRYFLLTCGAVFGEVGRPDLDTDALQHGVEKADINGSAQLLARTQPARAAARYGVVIEARPGAARVGKPRPFGYDVQVRQSGRLVARLRAAGRCLEVKRAQGLVTTCRMAKRRLELH